MPKTVYSKKLKESMFKRLAPPNAEKAPDIARETNIPVNTLYIWRAKVMKNNPTSNKKSSKWSYSDKFQAILKTASLSELETAKYCREKEKTLAETTALLVLRKKDRAIVCHESI